MRLPALALAAMLAACTGGSEPAAVGDPLPPGPAPTDCVSSARRDAPNPPETPLWAHDPVGALVDVTCDWRHYQPAETFCVKLDGTELAPGGTGPLVDGTDPACAFAGYAPEDTGLYRFSFAIPTLCAGCRRMFIDFTRIPADQAGSQLFYAHGHAYYRIASMNQTYTVEPIAHSPNTKNFYNDKLVSPPGTVVEQFIGAIDTHDMAYVTDVAHFIHTAIQGVHYIGPWYLNREGERIHGLYVDVNVGDATLSGNAAFDAFFYQSAYNSGNVTCIGNATPEMRDADLLYGGCVDRIGGSIDAYVAQ